MSSVPSQCQARTPVKRLVEASVWSHWPAQSEALPWASPTSDVSWGPWCSFFPGRFFTPSPMWWGLCNRFWRELLRCQQYEVETGWAIPFVVLGTRTVEPFSTHKSVNFQRPFAKRKKVSNPLITASGNSWHQITTNGFFLNYARPSQSAGSNISYLFGHVQRFSIFWDVLPSYTCTFEDT